MELSEIFSFDFKQVNGSAADREALVKTLFESGLQETLFVLIGLTIANLKQNREVPPGFCGRFTKALSNPVLGTMIDFLVWVHKNGEFKGLAQIHNHLLKSEAKNTGWLKGMIGLRNKFYHPKDEKVENILSRALEALDTVPDFDSWGRFERSDDNSLLWADNNAYFPLEPFLFLEGESVCFPKEFGANSQFKYSCGSERFSPKFEEWWKEARIRDEALEDPSAEDFFGKAKNLTKRYERDEPDWMSLLFKKSRLGYVVDQGVMDGILCHLKRRWPQAVAIDLEYKGEDDFLKTLATQVGFKAKPTLKTFLSWMNKESACLICFRAGEFSSQDFLKSLYWLLDLREAGAGTGLKVTIERSQVQVDKDMEKLWDRLPENLEEILNVPKRSVKELADYVWKNKEVKGMRRLFKNFM